MKRFQAIQILNPDWALLAGIPVAGYVILFTGIHPEDHFAMNGAGCFEAATGRKASAQAIKDCEEAMVQAGLRSGIKL